MKHCRDRSLWTVFSLVSTQKMFQTIGKKKKKKTYCETLSALLGFTSIFLHSASSATLAACWALMPRYNTDLHSRCELTDILMWYVITENKQQITWPNNERYKWVQMTFMTVMMNYSYIPFMNRYFTPGKVARGKLVQPFPGDWSQSPSHVLRWAQLYLVSTSYPHPLAQAWLGNRGWVSNPGCHPTHTAPTRQRFLRVVGLLEGGARPPIQAVPHRQRQGHQVFTPGPGSRMGPQYH